MNAEVVKVRSRQVKQFIRSASARASLFCSYCKVYMAAVNEKHISCRVVTQKRYPTD